MCYRALAACALAACAASGAHAQQAREPGPLAPRRLAALELQAGWSALCEAQGLLDWHAWPSWDRPELRFPLNPDPPIPEIAPPVPLRRSADASWNMIDAVILGDPGKGDEGGGRKPLSLWSKRQFRDFELAFEAELPEGGVAEIGFRTTLIATSIQPFGSWVSFPRPSALPGDPPIRASLRVRGDRLESTLGDAVATSSIGAAHASGIGLMSPSSRVRFANLFVRDLEALPGEPIELFDGQTLDGWRAIGDATWTIEDGELVGAVGGGSQSFLASTRELADFALELELKNEQPGNSGIQLRSHQNEQGRVFGYQIEIDPSARAWSGGLYDEARRGWLQNLDGRAEARAAFHPGAWNRYRIECVGPWIRSWVNGIPITDCFDPLDMAGFLALQVHSGKDTRMRWRHFELRELGEHRWMPWQPAERSPGLGRDLGLRLRWTGTAPAGRIELGLPPQAARSEAAAPATDTSAQPATRALWSLELRALPAVQLDSAPSAEHELALLHYGQRLELWLDGARCASSAGPDRPGFASLDLVLADSGVDAHWWQREDLRWQRLERVR